MPDLTGSAPPPNEDGTTAGLTHEWSIRNEYYTADVPIWIDSIASIEEWRQEFLKPEAKEVIEAIGGYVYVFRISPSGQISQDIEAIMRAIQEISEEHVGYAADNVMLAVGIGHGRIDFSEWDDACMQYGFEFVEYSARGKNEFSEEAGLGRLKEALEAHDWAAVVGDDEEDGLGLEDIHFEATDFVGGFGTEEAEMTAELFGMKAALNGAEDEDAEDFMEEHQADQVDDLEVMMAKLMAAKERAAELPAAQRRKVAAQAVREVIGEDSES